MFFGVWVYVAGVGHCRVWIVGRLDRLICHPVGLLVLSVGCLDGVCGGGVYVDHEVVEVSDGFMAQVRT